MEVRELKLQYKTGTSLIKTVLQSCSENKGVKVTRIPWLKNLEISMAEFWWHQQLGIKDILNHSFWSKQQK